MQLPSLEFGHMLCAPEPIVNISKLISAQSMVFGTEFLARELQLTSAEEQSSIAALQTPCASRRESKVSTATAVVHISKQW